MAGRVPQGLVDYTQKFKLPIVFVDYIPNRGKYSAVLIDNESGAFDAVSHLINQGHQKIAFLGGDVSHPSMSERLMGYKKALQEHGIAIKKQLIVEDEPETAFENGYQAAERLLNNQVKPTAIFACNDAMAIGCIKFLKENNIQIPEDISVVGFDDIEQDIMIEPHLTTVRVFKEELGVVALRRMVEMIENKNFLAGRVLVPVELVVRESTRNARTN
jgi:LacI family transcriptional regulator